jgi:hypothetical protein
MSILGKIFGRIFPKAQAAQPPAPVAPAGSAGPGNEAAAAARGQPAQAVQQPPSIQAAPAAAQTVDVEAVLDGLAAQNSQKLNWRSSIVDLMKLVGMESSLQERKELADELGYTGDKGDSARMNMWLHKAVMKKLAENGGKVPASLQD